MARRDSSQVSHICQVEMVPASSHHYRVVTNRRAESGASLARVRMAETPYPEGEGPMADLAYREGVEEVGATRRVAPSRLVR
jgi:hypothetical protein